MKNPYDTLQANHRAPYAIWEAIGKAEEAQAAIEAGLKEMQRTSGAYESDVIGELIELHAEIRFFVAAAGRAEKETLALWDEHHGGAA